MGFVARNSWSKGWVPNADQINAPVDALLRADNTILDEKNVLSLRAGSAKINGSAFADLDVHSLFTTYLSGTRYRMAGAGSAVYANGSSIASGLAGSDDIAFGFQLGQILFARSTSKKKYDGSTVRNWGIAMTGALPTLAPIAPDGKTFTTTTFGEVPELTKIEGGGPAGTVYSPNHYETTDPLYSPVGAVQIQMAATNRAVYQKTFAVPTNFTLYDAGRVGTENDLIGLYLYLSNPKLLKQFAIQVDVNDGTFLQDWFEAPFYDGSLPEASTTLGDLLPYDPLTVIRGSTNRRLASRILSQKVKPPSGATGSAPGGSANAPGWSKISWKRGDFVRSGSTFGKDWSTVKAIRILVLSTATDLVVKVDKVRIAGGALLGRVHYRYVYVRNASGYLARSAMSAPAGALFEGQDATVTIPADASRDSQVNEIWLYRQDLLMETFYRVQIKTGVSGTGGYALTDRLETSDALTVNEKIQLDNVVPPDSIIAIVGPHFDRTLVLTSGGQLWPSRKLDPDAFATGQTINVCGTDETPYWMLKAQTDIFIGTSKDIYRLEGTGAELPDGGVDYVLRPLSMDHRPVNAGLAHEGDQVVIFSDDGWRATQGGGTSLLTGETSLLYRGETRHGVSPVNIATGRVRAALAKGQLVAITPEGASTTSSAVLYRYVFATGEWRRHPYANAGHWRSIHREPDGTLIAGSDAGFVWILDTGTQDDGHDLAVTVWTKADDLGLPYQRKKMGDLMWRSDTGAATASVAAHLNGSAAAAVTLSAAQSGMGVNAFNLADTIAICKQIQFRITGSFSAFHLYDFGLQFRERPIPIIGRPVETWSGSPGVKLVSGYVLKCNTLGVARTITPLIDGVADTETFAITTGAEEPETLTLRFTLRARRAIDCSFAVDGELEIDSWSPIVTQRQPLGVKVWDSGPFMDGEQELVWLRELLFKVRAGADLVVTPYFDGRAFPSVTVSVTPDVDDVYRVPVGREYVGRQPRIVVTSCDPFYPYWVRAIRRTSGSPSQKKKVVAPFTLETGG